jgi:hypothetical protein
VEQSDLLVYLIEVLEREAIPYAIAGAHASMLFGEPRLTTDIDVVIDLTPTQLGVLSAAFPFPEYYISDQGAQAAVSGGGGMFNIIHPESGQKIDVIVPGTEHDRAQLQRVRRTGVLTGRPANFTSPEDSIIKKMEYYREGGSEKHLRDITGILKVTPVDRDYVRDWAKRLGLEEIWNAVLRRVD